MACKHRNQSKSLMHTKKAVDNAPDYQGNQILLLETLVNLHNHSQAKQPRSSPKPRIYSGLPTKDIR